VWNAAVAVAQENFFLEESSKEHSTLRFRVGTMWALRFRTEIITVSPNRTRVVVRARIRLQALEKSGRRSADLFFTKLAARLEPRPNR
jgi:hypothetical protein